MDKKMLNTTYDYELADGTTVKMTLAFYKLLQLKNKNKSLYERYNKAMVKQAKGEYDELDNITLLYAAYVCENLEQSDLLSEEDFFMLCGSDREQVGKALQQLTNPKKI